MLTKLTIYRPAELPEEREPEDWPEAPSLRFLQEKLAPLIGGGIERVLVFWPNDYADMFVDADSWEKGLPVNSGATEIYHNNCRVHAPHLLGSNPPSVVGVAVLISRRVWF